MFICRLILVLTIAFPQTTFAIDKGYFENLRPETAERVLMSFWGPVYYISGERTKDLRFSIPKTPYTTSAYEYAVLLFLTKKEAMIVLQQKLQTSPERLGLEGSNMNRMMVVQYKMMGKPNSHDINKPDYVIVDTLLPLMPVIETFVDEQFQPYVHELKGKKFIPAFLSRDDAIAFEETVNKSGKGKFLRRGLDFRSHLKFVENFIDSDTPIITFGEDIPRFMNYYVDNIAK